MNPERRICPPEFQERLTRRVGVNQYGEPLWKIAWGQTETFTAGGVWPHDHYFGYRQLMMSNGSVKGDGEPCWMVLEWRGPEKYGEAPVYYYQNRDELTGLQTLGEYPYRGRYEVAFKLTSTEYRNGQMEVLHYQLDGFILDWLVPILVEGQRMERAERMAMARQVKIDEDKAFDEQYEAVHKEIKLRPGARTQEVLDRELMIRRQMNEFLKRHGRVRPGFKTGSLAA